MSQQGLKVPKKAYFGAKTAVLGPNTLKKNYVREQKFWNIHIRKPMRHLVRIVLLVGHGTKWIRYGQYLAQNDQKCIFQAKFGRFGVKTPNSYGGEQKFWYPHFYGKTTRTPCSHCLVGHGIKWAKNASFWAKFARRLNNSRTFALVHRYDQ